MASRKRSVPSHDDENPSSSKFHPTYLIGLQLTYLGNMLSHIDHLIGMEKDRHDAILAELSFLREYALEGLPPRKRSRIEADADSHDESHDSPATPAFQSQFATLAHLARQAGLDQKLPCIKAAASRVAVRLLARVIHEVRNKGQGILSGKFCHHLTDVADKICQ